MGELPLLEAGQVWRRRDGTVTEPLKAAGPCTCLCNRGWIYGNQYDASAYYAFSPTTPSVHDLMALSQPADSDLVKRDGFVTKDSGVREEMPTGSVRDSREGKGRFDLISPFALRRLAGVYERGSIKYADRNWEKGQKFSRCLDSALRHLNCFAMGWTDEDHVSQALWNLAAILHFQETGRTELDDMPHYQAGPK